MNTYLRGKILREDYGKGSGRGSDWPSYPPDLNELCPIGASTSVVCAICGHPTGGLRFDTGSGEFFHRLQRECVPSTSSLR